MRGQRCTNNVADDEDITMIDTTDTPTFTHLARACARQLNYQVPSLLGILPNIHENMMLPKSNVFMLFRNGYSTDGNAKHWEMTASLRGFWMALQARISEH